MSHEPEPGASATGHARVVRAEFARQADAMAAAPAFTAEDVAQRFRDALGPGPGGRGLDLACGPGILTAALAAHGDLIVGVDLTPEMVRRGRDRCRTAGVSHARFVEAAAEALPFPAASFAWVVTRLSLHHLPEPGAALREVRRVLAPEGRLVLADVLASTDPAEARLHNALEQLRDPSHVRMLPEPELLQAVADAGFTVLAARRWHQPRQFGEWAAIVGNARSLASLKVVMRTLASAGLHAGIDLRAAGPAVEFVHRWLLVVAAPAVR